MHSKDMRIIVAHNNGIIQFLGKYVKCTAFKINTWLIHLVIDMPQLYSKYE